MLCGSSFEAFASLRHLRMTAVGGLAHTSISRSMRDQRAAALRERAKRLIAGDHAQYLVIIPGLGGFRRCLHLREIHVVDQPSVLSDMAVPRIEIVHRYLAHLRHHGLGLIGAGGRNGKKVMADGRIDGGLRHGRHPALTLEEALRPGAGLLVAIPVERSDEFQSLRGLEFHAVNIGNEPVSYTHLTLPTIYSV